MKLAHIFAAIAALLMAGTLFLPYQSHVSYNYDALLSAFNSLSGNTLPTTREYTAGLKLPETWPPAITIFLITVSFFIARNLTTAIIAVVLSSLLLLYMAFMAFILTFNLFGPTEDLEIGYYAGLLIVVGFLPFTIVHLSKTIRHGKQKAVREDIIDM